MIKANPNRNTAGLCNGTRVQECMYVPHEFNYDFGRKGIVRGAVNSAMDGWVYRVEWFDGTVSEEVSYSYLCLC